MTQAQLDERTINEFAEQAERLRELGEEFIFAKSRADYHRQRLENPWDKVKNDGESSSFFGVQTILVGSRIAESLSVRTG